MFPHYFIYAFDVKIFSDCFAKYVKLSFAVFITSDTASRIFKTLFFVKLFYKSSAHIGTVENTVNISACGVLIKASTAVGKRRTIIKCLPHMYLITVKPCPGKTREKSAYVTESSA